MKRILAVLLLSCCLAASAADQTYFGAWFATSLKTKGAAKDAGTLFINVNDVGNEGGVGTLGLTATQNINQDLSFSGTWERTKRTHILKFTADQVGGFHTTWTGTINLVTGRCSGTYKNDVSKGRFQTTFQPTVIEGITTICSCSIAIHTNISSTPSVP